MLMMGCDQVSKIRQVYQQLRRGYDANFKFMVTNKVVKQILSSQHLYHSVMSKDGGLKS